MLEGFIPSYTTFLEDLFDLYQESHDSKEIFKKSMEYTVKLIEKHDSSYKRDKICQKNPLFVQNEEKGIGMKWVSKPDPIANMARHSFKQTTFQYVPILSTLRSLFLQKEFEKMYFEYNSSHVCSPHKYEKFCCSSIYKKSNFFKDNLCAIQLTIFFDDFDSCQAQKSKSGINKTSGIYLQVHNVPQEYLSKGSNMYVLALCDTSNMLQDYSSLNDILELIVSEIQILETEGIDINENVNLKGTLINVCCDNLGGKTLFGFAESFNTKYYCRICESEKVECHTMVKEDKSTIRKVEDYEKCVDLAIKSKNIDLSLTKGIKKFCSLNQLENYHIFINKSVDLMHDLNEGIIPLVIKKVCLFCIEKKIVTEDELVKKIRDFNFGILNKKNIPSLVNFQKKNLNQNATQLYCLIIHLPFILSPFQAKLKEIWSCVETLLQIMQILYSSCITEVNVMELEKLIEVHLEDYQKFFLPLIPKQHFLVHYPNIIREMGPVKNFWMMRAEAKHQFFTKLGNKNYKNVTKTFAKQHQKWMLGNGFTYSNVITEGVRKTKLSQRNLSRISDLEENVELFTMKYLCVNNYEFRQGLMILLNNVFFEIIYLLKCNKGCIWFACIAYKVVEYNKFFNSLEVEKVANQENNLKLINLDDLLDKVPYERVRCEGKLYVIAETLTIKKEFYFNNI